MHNPSLLKVKTKVCYFRRLVCDLLQPLTEAVGKIKRERQVTQEAAQKKATRPEPPPTAPTATPPLL